MRSLSRNVVDALCLVSVLILLALHLPNGVIKGKVVPADAAFKVKGRSAVDSFVADIPPTGAFIIKNVKPGIYTLSLLTRPPYKPIGRSGIVVNGGDTVNIGDMVLVMGEAK